MLRAVRRGVPPGGGSYIQRTWKIFRGEFPSGFFFYTLLSNFFSKWKREVKFYEHESVDSSDGISDIFFLTGEKFNPCKHMLE